jgi:thiol-disulfide isomerase/thioredoxin
MVDRFPSSFRSFRLKWHVRCLTVIFVLCVFYTRADPFEEHKDAKAIVFVFVSNECPIANRYAPEIERLHKRYASNQIAFILVHSDPSETQEAIDKHTRDFGYTCKVVRDADQRLSGKAGASVTPEAAVFVNGKRVYRGRIDNRYAALGKARLEPTQRDLQAALDAIVQGKPVRKSETRAIGCYIPFPK